MNCEKEILIERAYNRLTSDAFQAYRDGNFGLLRHYVTNKIPLYLDALVENGPITVSERMKLFTEVLVSFVTHCTKTSVWRLREPLVLEALRNPRFLTILAEGNTINRILHNRVLSRTKSVREEAAA